MPDVKVYNSIDFQGTLFIKNLPAAVSAGDAVAKAYADSGDAASRARANHTGSQTANTISDFDTQVRTTRLDQMAAATAAITIVDGVSANHAATKGQLDLAISGLTSGQILKGAVEAYVTTNVNLASPGATLDGVTAANGEVYFLGGQSTASENGPYVFNGAASAMTRAQNWDTSEEAVLGSYWVVKRGTSADGFVLVTNDTAITLGSTAITSVVRGLAAAVTGYTATCPVVNAGQTWTITHNLNLASGLIQVSRVASPFDVVNVYATIQPGNVATVIPDVGFTSGEFRVAVQKVT